MDKFLFSIKRKYRERLLHREEQWPPVSIDKLVNLQLVETEKKEGFRAGLPQHGARDDDKGKRTSILHGNLFIVEEGKKPVRKLIVEGNAGIGKTTLCTMLTEEWANGKIFSQFDCVLLLPLRERSVSTATTLPQLFKLFHSSEKIRTTVIEELEEREGEGILIIADGWDELDQDSGSKNSFLYSLLFGDVFPFASVLLTSRPTASAHLYDLPTVDRLVEVTGFNEDNVKQYIESEFEKCPEKAYSLIEQLENNPAIRSLCSVPLNCAIICYLWHTLDRVLPRTLTELYAQIVQNVILRNIKKKYSQRCSIGLQSFDTIPANLQDMFWLTCKFAYECLLHDRIVFSESEVVSFFPDMDPSEQLQWFGLLQYGRSLLPVGQGLSFHFVHLTIQEFLAALHLVTLPNEEKLKVCEAHAKSVRFVMLWRFMFGLGCQRESSYSRKVVCLDDKVVDRFLKATELYEQCLLLCHCSLESLNNIVSSKIAKRIDGQLRQYFDRSIAHTPFDCTAIVHVVQCTSQCSNMALNLNNCGMTDKLLRELTDILSYSNGELQFRSLSLCGNKFTVEVISDIFTRAAASFSSLAALSLNNNNITDIPSQLWSGSRLVVLSLSNNPLEVSCIQSFETAVQEDVLINLEILSLSSTLTDDADINGALLASLLRSISYHCPHLRDFDLSKNNLGVPGANTIGELFIRNRQEFKLDLCDTRINVEAVSSLNIANGASKRSSICTVLLSDNPLKLDGLLAMLKMLRSETCPITTLLLCNTDLTTPVCTQSQYYNIQHLNTLNLGPVFESSKMTHLDLSENNFSGERVLILAECLRVCKVLQFLICSSCSLTSLEITSLLDHVRSYGHHDWLAMLDLSNNYIDDEGGTLLIENLSELFPWLQSVNLIRNNLVSTEVEERLEKVLEVSIFILNFCGLTKQLSIKHWNLFVRPIACDLLVSPCHYRPTGKSVILVVQLCLKNGLLGRWQGDLWC